jgi:hypothetical protein
VITSYAAMTRPPAFSVDPPLVPNKTAPLGQR